MISYIFAVSTMKTSSFRFDRRCDPALAAIEDRSDFKMVNHDLRWLTIFDLNQMTSIVLFISGGTLI